MKIGVVSDTHGDILGLKQAVETVGTVDMWLHAGDYSQDGRYLAELTGVPVVTAAGNCDGHTDAKIDEFITIDSRNIWLTHGHRYQVKHGRQELAGWGRHFEVNIIVYGHTHMPDITWEQDLLIFNPGSASQRRCENPTCGLLEFCADSLTVNASIIEL